jgi:Zn-dependent protease with chaperone function
MSPWAGPESFLGSSEGQMVFFAIFLGILMVFIPPFIQYWWGCKPFEPSDKLRELKTFLHTKRFRYRDLLRWPIFEGRMMTAGIMGIIPRFRYILITDSLMEILSIDELKAVMAHEVGHAKYRHLLFYLLFFLGFMVLSYGLFDLFLYFFAAQPFFMNESGRDESHVLSMFYLALSLPILITMFVYFRYVMGFFMRQFERQADSYSAITMGSPRPTISSLEKIALLSGKSRDLPSWHHFSIKERVDYLWRTLEEPSLIKRHNRFVAFSFAAYVIAAITLGYILNFSPLKQTLKYYYVDRINNQQLAKEPDNILLYRIAWAYQRLGRYDEAIETYERIISLDRQQATALNNLAWLLVAEAEDELRDPQRALALAKDAVALERFPTFLDTLAEAYYANGLVQEAIETIKEALDLATENRGYYKKQLKKFMSFEKSRP